jgi:hypothetical protein
MPSVIRNLIPALLMGLAAAPVAAQDRVTYRDRASKGPQTATGKIDTESLAGIRIASRTIPIADVIDVQYDVPAAIKLEYPRAIAAEARSPAEAVPVYEGLLRLPAVQNNKAIKRHVEFRIAMLTAARGDESPAQSAKAVAALAKFKADHPDAWQLLPITRALARLDLDREPPDYDGARKAYEDLAAAPGAPPEVKQECSYQVLDLLLLAGKPDEAKRIAAALPASDPKAKVYQIGGQPGPAAAKQLEAMIEQSADRGVKAVAYNMLGDVYRRDPKTKKDAVYAYLWVDVWYNDDPAEVAKADGRLASLFAELKDEERAKKYREKARGK